MTSNRKQDSTQESSQVELVSQYSRDGPASMSIIKEPQPQPPTNSFTMKEKRSLSSTENEQESKRDEDKVTGAKRSRSEGSIGKDTDCRHQAVSQPDQTKNVAESASPLQNQNTAHDHRDAHWDADLDHKAMEIEIASAESEIARTDDEIASTDARTARNDARIAARRMEVLGNDARIFNKEAEILVLVKENNWLSERAAEMSEENQRMNERRAEMVRRNETMEVRNAIMGTILHIAKGDDTLVAMSKEGLGKARLTAQQLVQVREAMERIYKAGRRPSDEEVEDVLQKAKRLRAPVSVVEER